MPKRRRNKGKTKNEDDASSPSDEQNKERRKKPRNDTNSENWTHYNYSNEKFVEYYKGLQLLPEDEWQAFLDILKIPLPTTFRINATSQFADYIRNQLLTNFQKITTLEFEGETVKAPTPLSWYPNQMAWHFTGSKKILRKAPQLADFRKFLVAETEQGNISRQEAVSMLPPLFLDVQPHHKVLDVCAAPGSKTAQLLENLDNGSGVIASGVVIANDMDVGRCYMLVHQTKRLHSPNIVITNHEGQAFPQFSVINPPELKNKKIFFDRILCDVPCTGDGTLRKSPEMWRKWVPTMGIGMHRLQLRIAIRSAQLLAVGGRMVYSTCSFNPLENEAVVAELLQRFKGALELVDVSHIMPELRRRPGLLQWSVYDNDKTWYKSFDQVPTTRHNKIKPSAFPPPLENTTALNLQKCMRFFPHHQDTGGFFIAVIQRISSKQLDGVLSNTATSPSTSSPDLMTNADTSKMEITTDDIDNNDDDIEKPAPIQEDPDSDVEEIVSAVKNSEPIDELAPTKGEDASTSETTNSEDALIFHRGSHKEAPYTNLTDLSIIDKIKNFYGLKDNFPYDNLLARSDKSQRIYFVAPSVKTLLQADTKMRLRIINMGVKLFEKNEAAYVECDIRIVQEGLHYLLPFLTKRIIMLPLEEFVLIVRNKCQNIDTRYTAFCETSRKNMEAQSLGCVVYILESTNNIVNSKIAVSGWRGRTTTHPLVAKQELQSLLEKLIRIFNLNIQEQKNLVNM